MMYLPRLPLRRRPGAVARIAAMLIAPVLVACSAGQPSMGFIDPTLMAAYIPLSQSHDLIFSRWGAAYTIAPHVAVTNDHNLNFVPPGRLLARSRDYDLLFFRTDSLTAPPIAKARLGEAVIAYGQGRNEALREASGRVTALADSVPPRCADCRTQRALVFEADAGPGFSGGPVADAATGAVLGIVFGYRDPDAGDSGRLMYAYDMDLVLSEMRRLLDGGNTADSGASRRAVRIGSQVLIPSARSMSQPAGRDREM
jgi:hypothetical protein